MKHPLRLSTSEFAQNSHYYFAWMRQEAPVYKANLTRWKDAYLVTRYEDVAALLTDERLVKNASNAGGSGNGMFWMPKAMEPLLHNMLNSDEPDHRRSVSYTHLTLPTKA
jgi:cytochrome P450